MKDNLDGYSITIETPNGKKRVTLLTNLIEDIEEGVFKLNTGGYRYNIEHEYVVMMAEIMASDQMVNKGHYQRTEELALEVHKKHSYIATMTQLKDYYDRDGVIDWSNHQQSKYYFIYKYPERRWLSSYGLWAQNPVTVYFSKPFKEVLNYLNKHHPKGFEL